MNIFKKIVASLAMGATFLFGLNSIGVVEASARGNNYCIDIYNGDEISVEAYDRIARDGTSVIIKATEGTTGIDSYARYRGNICQEKGIDFSFYHMLTATTAPETQAENFYNVTKNYNNTMLNALDVEYPGVARVAENYANRFMQRYYELSGQNMMVYSCESYLHENFSQEFLNNNYLWCANYGRKPNVPNLVIHQFKEGTDPTHNYGGNWKGEIDQNEIYMPEVLYISGNTEYHAPAYNNAEVAQNPVNRDGFDEWLSRLQAECNSQGFSSQVIDGLKGKNSVAGCPLLRYRAEGNITKLLQEKLVSLGYNTNGIDGKYYGGTKQAVKQFQRDNKLKCVDGIMGKESWKTLIMKYC